MIMITLSQEIENLIFYLQRFADSDDAARFYRGFPNCSKYISFYEFLLPSTNYWGLNNAEDRSSFEEKCGPRRILTNR